MQEYPKALYKGHKKNHEHVVAKNAEHEQELRDAEYVDHWDLPDDEVVDYSSWTAEKLREEITNRGKEFKARDSKSDLISILEG
ncbi:hypothetical protein ACX1N5_04085 [Acinetobacter sp. ANC 4636]